MNSLETGSYKDALDYIHGTLKFGIKLGLDNITSLLDRMGNPHKKLKYVHVGGTNGKGSTVAFISSMLIEAGYKVGIYTSPYLERFTERIKINHEEISEQDLAGITSFVKSKADDLVNDGGNHPTEFEIVTAIAFQYFYQNSCDIVVLEVGLGGRFDSTNVIDTPLVSVITTISYDHMDKLGNTLVEIANEKAGIIKENGDVVLYPQSEELEKLFFNVCYDKGSIMYRVSFIGLKITQYGVEGQIFSFRRFNGLQISMLGEHQVKNAVVALKAIEILNKKGFGIMDGAVSEGLKKAKWPGRLEVLSKDPLFIIDGAHNEEGAKVLQDTLEKYFPDRKKIFIIGVLKDKDYKAIIEPIIPMAEGFIAVTPHSERALSSQALGNFLSTYCKNVVISDTIDDAIKTALKTVGSDGMICAFGSLYYIGEVRKFFKV